MRIREESAAQCQVVLECSCSQDGRELPWAGEQRCEPRSSGVQEPFRGGRRIMSAAMQEQLDDRDKKGPCSTLYTFTEVNLEGTVGLSVHF